MIAMHTGGPASTVHKNLVRHDLNRLARTDRLTGRAIRRCERAHPGQPIHPDIGKVAGIPPGGRRVRGRGQVENHRIGCTDLHCAVDDRSRVARVEAHDDERAETPVGFRSRTRDRFRARAMTVDDATSDNGSNFRNRPFAAVPAERATRHRGTRPYRPRSNGKVERFNRTTADELLHSFTFRSDNERRRASTAGSTTTTITATTPPSAAHPHHASTTSVAPTPSVRDVPGQFVLQRRKVVAVAGHRGDVGTARAGLADEEPTVRIAAIRSLRRLGELTTGELSTALTDGTAAVRITALEIAAILEEPPIIGLLDDDDAMVVESAAWALGERPDPPGTTIDALVEVATGHEDPLAREAAVAALGAIGDDRGLPAVLAATSDKPAVRRRAVVALAAFEGAEVDAAWVRARDDHDRQVRDAVDELLGLR